MKRATTPLPRSRVGAARRLGRVLAAVTLVIPSVTLRPHAQSGHQDSFVAGEVLVKFRSGSHASLEADAHRLAGGTPLEEISPRGLQRTAVPAGIESTAIARYTRNPNVLYAQPNYIRRVGTPGSESSASAIVPGDYYFGEQWALHSTGQPFHCVPGTSGTVCSDVATPDADIDAPEGWAITTGTAAVTVAVIDTGIDYNHPDLAANYAGGYDFVSSDDDPMDDQGHGTIVAGTIAAALNNLAGDPAVVEGVVGVAPNARVLAYKVCDSQGACTDFDIARAIARAVTDGASVINMSLGDPVYSQVIDEAVQDAWHAGLVIVAAAGNDGTMTRFYPAAFDHVVSVAAFDKDHMRPAFSNYGTWVDVSAPGSVIMTTARMTSCPGVAPGTGCYRWLSGTSMSAPHVSGAAALVWARDDVTSNSQVVDILLGSADAEGVASVRLDAWTIHGGLNLGNALSYGLLPPAPTGLRFSQ